MKGLLLGAALAWSGASVVHFGDSHVAAGLSSGLRARFLAAGARYHSDYWVSSSTVRWAYGDRLPKLLRRHRADVVIITLGSNEALFGNLERYGKYMERLVGRLGERRCFWVGPPRYRRFNVDRIVEAQARFAAPCEYFDSREVAGERTRNNLHFTRAGGEAWADAIWRWMNDGAASEPAGGVGGVAAVRSAE